jgi:hypothetical protein
MKIRCNLEDLVASKRVIKRERERAVAGCALDYSGSWCGPLEANVDVVINFGLRKRHFMSLPDGRLSVYNEWVGPMELFSLT